MKNRLVIFSAATVVALAWLLAPVYLFFAHRGAAPLPPYGWEQIEGQVPEHQQVFDPVFEARGHRGLKAMAAYRAEANLPSLSAAVAVSDRVVWAGAVGYRDIAVKSPMKTDTLFRIGSASKALTATALARLVEQGELDLDAPLSEYWSNLPNPAWGHLTPRQLASHSAGLPHYGDNRDWVGLYQSMTLDRRYPDVRGALAVFDASPLLHRPGAVFHYSSLGTVLLGATMSEVSGLSYRELMRREVFEPAGMSSTFPDGEGGDRAGKMATLYYTDGERFRRWRDVDLSHRLPGGGFVSTPTDLVRLGKKYFDPDYLSPRTRELFWTPQKLADGSVNEENYALGWRWSEWDIEGIGMTRSAHHGGVSRGSQCWLLVYPDYVMSMAFCTNVKTEEFRTFGLIYEPLLRAFAAPSP